MYTCNINCLHFFFAKELHGYLFIYFISYVVRTVGICIFFKEQVRQLLLGFAYIRLPFPKTSLLDITGFLENVTLFKQKKNSIYVVFF